MDKEKNINEDLDEETLTTEEDIEEKQISEEQDGLASEINDLQTKLVRLQADFQNYKKRVEKEKDDLVSIGVISIVNQMLPVIDNFERALEQDSSDESFKEGIKMIYEGLKNALKEKGISEITSLGEEFNPDLHQAVSMGHDENYEENMVINVLQKGYEYNGKVIRHAMVIVNK